ncbi:hypothetical protein [Streptomyces zagrosensis]|uniref:Uncharacterized protein n=1 Tax=Streptomyces zagrosensis TaxID=1042984 RepID=A0A7W9QGR0_9ACTN|nr:hypothetical protein [Streptomyces zagrosensis]MBB5939699.1 hypothetical protein [Streptomyces zagrosensis]
MSGSYEAHPAALRRFTEDMKQLPAQAKQLGKDFQEDQYHYVEWPGWTDDFAHTARPAYNKNNEFCVQITGALYQAFDAAVSATLMNLGDIEGTEGDMRDRIDAHRRRTTDGPDDPDGGKR